MKSLPRWATPASVEERSMPEALAETENWVAIGFLLFLALLVYLGVHRKVIASLDQRQARIKSELDEARRLKEEAQALLAEFQRKGREAESEAEAIIAGAKAEAVRLAAEAKTRMEDFVARRTKMAEGKIAQAEAQALADVRSAAADAAVAAAEKILSSSAKGKVAEDLLARGIEDVKQKLN
jgi:F-type H+-transporting ATPase subunit b